MSNGFLKIDGYNIFKRRDRNDTTNGFGGGILVYAKVTLTCHEIDLQLLNEFTQAVGITMETDKGKLNIVTIYRPHRLYNGDSTRENNDKLIELIKNVPKPYLLCGDFNYPGIDWTTMSSNTSSEKFVELLLDEYISQHVEFPTHTGGSILDLVLTSNDDIIHGIEDHGCIDTSDHTCIIITTTINPKNTAKTEKWSWNRADKESIKTVLADWNWRDDMQRVDISAAVEIFNSKISDVMNKYIPKYIQSSKPRPPWMNVELLRTVRKKRRLWRAYTAYKTPEKLQEYKIFNRKCKRKIMNAKKRFEHSLTEHTNMDTNRFFNYIKKRKNIKEPIGPLKEDNILITDDKGIANQLNNFFCSVFTEEADDPPQLESIRENITLYTDPKITTTNVDQKVKNLKKFGAPGPDGIFPSFLMDYRRELTPPLTYLCKQSLETATVPRIWKKANVVPIFKKGSKFSAGNYRPISLTCITGRICESIIKDRIVEHLASNNLILPSQFGFLKRKSCVLNLLTYLEQVTNEVDHGQPVDIIYLESIQ